MKDSSDNIIGGVGYFQTYHPWGTTETKTQAYIEELEAKVEEWKDLGAPVFDLYPGLTMVTVVGRLDTSRFDTITSNLLSHVKSAKSRVVLIDLSAALVADDANISTQLIKTIRIVHLLGACCILAGIQTSVAQDIEPVIEDIYSIKSFCDTELALIEALSILGFEICKKD